jgi:hypothetical protein
MPTAYGGPSTVGSSPARASIPANGGGPGGNPQLNWPGNYVELNAGAGVHSQSQNANSANGVVVAAVALRVKFCGVFTCKANVFFSENTTGKTVKHTLCLNSFTNPTTRFSGGATTGLFFGNDVASESQTTTLSSWGQWLNAEANGDPTNGVLFNGVSPNLGVAGTISVAVGTDASLTGLLTAQAAGSSKFFWEGFATKTAGLSKTTFTRDDLIVLSLLLNSVNTDAGDVVTYQHISLAMQENMLP